MRVLDMKSSVSQVRIETLKETWCQMEKWISENEGRSFGCLDHHHYRYNNSNNNNNNGKEERKQKWNSFHDFERVLND